MTNEIEYNDNYLKGFNNGYILSKYSPELAEKLSQVKSESPRMEGFRDGRTEFVNEKSHYPQWLKRDFSKGLDTKDKGDREPDKE